MVKIIDQLLPDVFYNRLLKILDDNDKEFNWFWNTRTAESANGEPLDDNFMFTHLLYNKDYNGKSVFLKRFSQYFIF